MFPRQFRRNRCTIDEKKVRGGSPKEKIPRDPLFLERSFCVLSISTWLTLIDAISKPEPCARSRPGSESPVNRARLRANLPAIFQSIKRFDFSIEAWKSFRHCFPFSLSTCERTSDVAGHFCLRIARTLRAELLSLGDLSLESALLCFLRRCQRRRS